MQTRHCLPLAVVSLVLLFSVGCDTRNPVEKLDLVYLPDQIQPPPVNDLPEELRVKNWIGTDQDGDRGGSCVHAAIIHTFRSAGRNDLEQVWYVNRGRGYEGPETAYRIMDKLDDQNIPFAATEDGDIRLLEEASKTHRQAAIFYYPSHCINFQEFAYVETDDFVGEAAILLDSNFPDRYIVVDRQTFERSWEYYGGFAVVPWIEPVVPRSFPRALPRKVLQNGYL